MDGDYNGSPMKGRGVLISFASLYSHEVVEDIGDNPCNGTHVNGSLSRLSWTRPANEEQTRAEAATSK